MDAALCTTLLTGLLAEALKYLKGTVAAARNARATTLLLFSRTMLITHRRELATTCPLGGVASSHRQSARLMSTTRHTTATRRRARR